MPRHVLPVPEVASSLDRWTPITVVRGIQGYGKTTAVATWLGEQPEEVLSVWLSARGSSSDPVVLRGHLGRALERAGLGGATLEGSHRWDPIAALDHASYVHADERLVLVIDDAHELHHVRHLESLVEVVAQHDNLHLVLCSRGPHRIESLAAGVVEVVTIPPRALLMSVEQIMELAGRMDAPLTLRQARQLHREFGGWAAAVQLVLDTMSTPVDDLPLARAEAYLRDTVLPQIGDRRMLWEISRFALAERLTHRLIRDLAEDQEADALVRLVEAPGLAERRYEGAEGAEVVLQLPSFIKSGLRDLFTAEEPAAARVMHRRLASWYADHDGPNHPLYALRHAVDGEDWKQANRIWTRHSTALGMQWPGDLGKVLRDIPEPVVADRPGMRVAREMTRVMAQTSSQLERRIIRRRAYAEASRQLAADVYSALPLHDLLYVGTGHLIALRTEGRLAESDRLADELEATATSLMSAGQDAGDRLPSFHLQRGHTRTLLGDHQAAIHHYQLAWRTRHLTAPQVGASAASNLALTYALVGDPHASRHWLDLHANLDTPPSQGNMHAHAGARIATALLSIDRLDVDRTSAELDSLRWVPADHELRPLIDFLNAEHHLHVGSFAAGLGILDAAVPGRPDEQAVSTMAASLLLQARADLLLAAGEAQHARSMLAGHPGVLDARLVVVSARISLLAGDPLAASRLTSGLLRRTTTDNRTRQELLLLHALAAHHMNDTRTSADMTRQALALYESTGILRSFASVAPDDLDTLLDHAEATLPPHDLETLQRYPAPFPRCVEVIELTARERVLAAALASLASRQEIADQLYVSVNTVRSQLVTLYRKLDVNTREQALARLEKLGLT